MPLKKMTVETMKTTSEQTISSMVDQGMVDIKRTPYPPSYIDRMSWFAVLYRFVPDGIGVAGIRYAFNPREIKLRRSVRNYPIDFILFWIHMSTES